MDVSRFKSHTKGHQINFDELQTKWRDLRVHELKLWVWSSFSREYVENNNNNCNRRQASIQWRCFFICHDLYLTFITLSH